MVRESRNLNGWACSTRSKQYFWVFLIGGILFILLIFVVYGFMLFGEELDFFGITLSNTMITIFTALGCILLFLALFELFYCTEIKQKK